MKRLATIACFMALSASGFAGEKKPPKPYAVIFGTVYGPDNHSVPGVTVRIRRADDQKKHWELVSDSNGEFAQRVPAGKADYVVEPKLNDKQAAEKARVTVHVENEERQDLALHLIAQEKNKQP